MDSQNMPSNGTLHVQLEEPISFNMGVFCANASHVNFEMNLIGERIHDIKCREIDAQKLNFESLIAILRYLFYVDNWGSFCRPLVLWKAICCMTGRGINIAEEAFCCALCECERIRSHIVNINQIIQMIGLQPFQYHSLQELLDFSNFPEKIAKIIYKIFQGKAVSLLSLFPDVDLEHNLNRFCYVSENILIKLGRVLQNHLFQFRTRDIGVLFHQDAENYSLSGPNARASGIRYDARSTSKIYTDMQFEPLCLKEGDVYSRCCLRLNEALQSVKLIQKFKTLLQENVPPAFHFTNKEIYECCESPCGEFGIYLVPCALSYKKVNKSLFQSCLFSDTDELNDNRHKLQLSYEPKFDCCKIHGSSFNTLQILPTLCECALFSNLGLIIQSVDIVQKEIIHDSILCK